jgi:hypothetical protein
MRNFIWIRRRVGRFPFDRMFRLFPWIALYKTRPLDVINLDRFLDNVAAKHYSQTTNHEITQQLHTLRVNCWKIRQCYCNTTHGVEAFRYNVTLIPVFNIRSARRTCKGRGHIDRGPIHPCGGGVEYLHRNPASRKRRRKGKSRIWDSKLF